jgi:hypothetical protein
MVKAYAHDLKDYFDFLTRRGLDWREVRLEDIGEYVAWLRLPLLDRGERGRPAHHGCLHQQRIDTSGCRRPRLSRRSLISANTVRRSPEPAAESPRDHDR